MFLSVCPHDIVKQMQTWLEMSTYLAQRLGQPVRLRKAMDFREFYEGLEQSDMAFVNPMDAWYLSKEYGFLPICRTELYDEVVFFTSENSPLQTLDEVNGLDLGAVEHQFATYLGLYVLREQGIEVGNVVFLDSWIQVIRQVTQGQIPYGVLYKDFFMGLKSLSRSMIRVIYESNTKYATHMFLIHPKHQDLRTKISSILEEMVDDSEGKQLIETLRLGRWVPVQDLSKIDEVITVAEREVLR